MASNAKSGLIINKTVRDLLVFANPLITGVAAVGIKVTAQMEWTPVIGWMLGQAILTGIFAIYLHLITSAPQAIVTRMTPGGDASVAVSVPLADATTTFPHYPYDQIGGGGGR